MEKYHLLSLEELRLKLDKKEISSYELTNYFLERISKYNKDLNSIITITKDLALKQAINADNLIKENNQSFLTGIPIIHKDIFCTKDIKTSCGSKMLDNFIAPYNATLIEDCEKNGLVILGKSNMDEFAMGSTNENSYYGSVKNPWNLNYVAGGSSGGSSCSVSAYLAPLATGTDTGGSIRQPASFCGITGIKPTYGSISRFGMVAYASSFDQAGVFAKTSKDCAFLLKEIIKKDCKDSTSIENPNKDLIIKNLDNDIKNLKIGVPFNLLEKLGKKEKELCKNAILTYEKLGAKIIDINLKNIDIALPSYYILAPAEASSNLAKYDGVRFGYRTKNPKNIQELYKKSRSEGFGKEVKKRILLGTWTLSSGYYDAYYEKAQKVRRVICNEFKNIFENIDIIFMPCTTSSAFKLGDNAKSPIEIYLSDIFTVPINLAGLPALSHNIGFINKMPFGAQLVGNYFDESKILNASHKYQTNTDFHKKLNNFA